MKFYGISCYCSLYTHTHTHLSVYLNLGKECMKQPYLWIDIILGLKIIFPECYLGCENNPVSPSAFLLDSHTTYMLTQPPCSHHPLLTLLSHHLPAHTTSLLIPPLAHFTLTPSLAHFTLTPSPCSLYCHTIPCSFYSHTTSLLTPPLSDTRCGGGRFPHQAVLCDPSWVSYDLTQFSKHSLTYNQR